MTVTPHPSLPGVYQSHEWDFDESLDADGDIAFVERAILAWSEWREFLVQREHAEKNEELDFDA